MKLSPGANVLQNLKSTWLVTGCAGFIGSNLAEYLLLNGQKVVGLDNFSAGKRENISDLQSCVGAAWSNFTLIEGDIRSLQDCRKALQGIDHVLHQAALGSVPRSIEDPLQWNEVNVSGFLNILVASRDAKVRSFVYASSSSVYGDSEELPKREEAIGVQLSPYAVSKYANELYAGVFARCYNFSSVGLRYFNVFGKRQDPEGAYAAVVPRWIDSMVRGEQTIINGDGTTTRDFCYITNVIQANILSALFTHTPNSHRIFNVGVGERTDLLTLHSELRAAISKHTGTEISPPVFAPFRAGDVRHSLAAKDEIEKTLGFKATHKLREGINDCISWYLRAR